MAIGPNDYYGELQAPPEEEWPGELPEHIVEWEEWWWNHTFHPAFWDQMQRWSAPLKEPLEIPNLADVA